MYVSNFTFLKSYVTRQRYSTRHLCRHENRKRSSLNAVIVLIVKHWF